MTRYLMQVTCHRLLKPSKWPQTLKNTKSTPFPSHLHERLFEIIWFKSPFFTVLIQCEQDKICENKWNMKETKTLKGLCANYTKCMLAAIANYMHCLCRNSASDCSSQDSLGSCVLPLCTKTLQPYNHSCHHTSSVLHTGMDANLCTAPLPQQLLVGSNITILHRPPLSCH